MKKLTAISVMVMLLVGIMACTPAQQVKPETVSQKVIYAYGLIDGVAGTVDSLYQAGVLTKKETGDAARTLEQAWNALDKAEELYALGKQDEYQANLESALKIINVLQSFMLERSRK